MKNLLIAFLCLAYLGTNAQKVHDETVEYHYKQMPTNPIKTSKDFISKLEVEYESEVMRELQSWETQKKDARTKFKADSAMWVMEDKRAEEQYQADLVEYNKKSVAQKVVEKKLLEESKPYRHYPSKPYYSEPSEPKHRTLFDKKVLADQHLVLYGYNKVASGTAITYTVTIHGFELGEKKKESFSSIEMYNNVAKSVMHYYYTYKYRFPMTVKVIDANGTVLMNERVVKFDEYDQGSTGQQTSDYSVSDDEWYRIQKRLEEEMTSKYLDQINEIVNGKYGFLPVKVRTEVFFVKNKDGLYDDFDKALTAAKRGYSELISAPESAKENLEEATAIWTKALAESNVADKKARVNENVTIALLFNLIESSINIYHLDQAAEFIAKLEKMEISKREKERVKAFGEHLYATQKRFKANN
jgi:hypothetical protein